MQKLKKWVLLFSLALLVFGGTILSGCENDNSMKLELSKTNIEITLGENDNTDTLQAIVTDAKTKEVVIDYDNQEDIIVTSKYKGNGITDITVKALRQCSNVDVIVKGAKVSKTFRVSASSPISSIVPKQDTYYFEYNKANGGSCKLSNDLVVLFPEATSQTGIKYALASEIEGVSISNNYLVVEPNLDVIPTGIDVEVISVYNESVKTTLHFEVVKSIDVSLVEIKEDNNVDAKLEYNIPRNNPNKNQLLLKVVVPYSVSQKLINVKPVYAYGDMGLNVDEQYVLNDTQNQVYEYSFKFGFLQTQKTGTITDKVWFELSYIDFPEIISSTKDKVDDHGDNVGIITLTAYDEITGISVSVNDANVTNDQFNLYTSYSNSRGLKVKFDAIPFTAINSNFVLSVDAQDLAYISIMDENGTELNGQFVNGKFDFVSGKVFYLIAKVSEDNKIIPLTITNKDDESENVVTKTINLSLKEGVRGFGFVTGDTIETEKTFYFENKPSLNEEQEEQLLNERDILFSVAPASIEIDNLSVLISGDGVFTVGHVQFVSKDDNSAIYKVHVSALKNSVGEGTLIFKFESGQQIKANIKVIERLTNVGIDVDLMNYVSSAVGKLTYDESGNLSYIAIKNGRMVPLKFTSNMASNILFEFFDRELSANDDVYAEDGEYSKFNELDCQMLNMSQSSNILNTEVLRSNDYLTTLKLGKVWVKATFVGSMLNENYELVKCEIDKYFLVEVYNPVQSLTISDRVIELYAYNEVGEKNKALSKYTFTVKINDANSPATYDRIYFAESPDYESGVVVEENTPYLYFSPQYDETQLVIEKVGNNFIATANFRVEDSNNLIQMYIFANDIGGNLTHYVKEINFVIQQAQRVEQIIPTNVDVANSEYNLYLSAKSISNDYNDNNFRIICDVLPENALVKDVSYIFYPDNGTRNDIITISNDGLVSVTGEYGGKGTIVIVPTDAILLDSNGNTYYRENTPVARINLTVADGKSRETSVRITDASQITNQDLHYTAISNINVDTAIFRKFNGGLYGQLSNSNFKATLTLNSYLFEEISESAIVADFDVVCNVTNGSGSIANVNNGTIESIVIDSYSQENYSLVQNNSEYVGGVVGQNNGTISNVIFQGSVLGDDNLSAVGGIAGKNTGKIENCKVIFYDLKDGSAQMSMQGQVYAGLVGEIAENGIISKSYAYNFGKNNAIVTDANIFGIVGKISSANTKITESFANLGVAQKIFGELSQNVDDKKVIKDSYITYKNNDSYEFTFYMTKQNGQTLTGTATDFNYIYNGVKFGSSEIWLNNGDSQQNFGYPYLKNVKRIVPITASELENLKIQRTNLSFNQDENNAILFVNKTVQTLTERENKALTQKNTISLLDLFGISSVYGLNIESNSNILALTNGTLQINNIGDATLTISSKYDRSIDPISMNIKVIYNTNNFGISYNDYSLPSGYTIGLKKGTTQKFITSLEDNIVLNQTKFSLQTNDFDVVFENKDDETKLNNVVGNKIGTHLISLNSDDDLHMSVYLKLNGLSDAFAKILKNETLKTLTLKPLQGPNSIAISVKEVNMSASDSLEFQVNINSDVKDEQLACEIFDENGIKIFSQDASSLTVNKQNELGLFNVYVYSCYTNNEITNYDLSIELNKEKLSMIDSSYYIVRFYAGNIYSSVYVDLKISVIDQEIIRIDVNNYSYRETSKVVGGERYNYYPTNTISTTKPSLLDVMIYPSYANFEYITVTSEPVNGQKLALLSMRKGDEEGDASAYFVDKLMNFEFIENGVKIFKNSSNLSNDISRFYVRALASSDIKTNTIFNIYINVYGKDNTILYTQMYSLLVTPPVTPGLSIDGESGTYFALLGDTLTVQVIKEKSQTLKNNYKLSSVVDGKEVDTGFGTILFNNDWQDIDTTYEKGTFTVTLSETNFKDVTMTIETSRVINGIEETLTSQMLIYIIPFDFDIENTAVKNSNSKDKAFGDIYFEHELDFDFAGKYTKYGKKLFEYFISNNYCYSNSQNGFGVNKSLNNSSKAKVLRSNLYYVNGDTKTPIYNSTTNKYIENNIIEFSEVGEGTDAVLHYIGKTIGSQKMLLEIPVQMPDGNRTIYKYNFTIEIKAELNDDEPVQIFTADEFLEKFNAESEEHYILMRDIRLYEYTPISSTTSVASLDGNGYTISIVSFAQGVTNYSLFENVDSNTLLKNIRLNIYNIGTINVDSSQVSEINVAPMAITNNGIITNSEVVNYFDISVDIRQQSTGILISTDSTTKVTAKTAGFVLYNNGTITNSRVGGTKLDVYKVEKSGSVKELNYRYSYGGNSSNYDLPVFTINSFGEIAGFVYENNGSITSSFASNIRIINNSQINYTTITSGFVINNNGTISMSYAKGVKASETDIHATKFGIETSGIASGFAYQNKGNISDCYSNINLTNLQNNPGRSSAGFVYSNTQGGKVKNSLSLSRIISSTTTQMNFSGVDELGNYISDKDSITNSYYYDQVALESDTISFQKAYGESASSVSSVIIEEYFYGFNFASTYNDGIWKMTAQGPDLVSANDIAVSLRYTSKASENLSKPKTAYVDKFAYGSINNPILIRNAKDFNEAFSGTANKSVDRFVDDSTKTIAFGNYRLIDNIDLHDLATGSEKYDLTSSIKTLSGSYNTRATGKLDGNGFTISNFALTDSGNNKSLDSFGLFSKLEGGALVINLNIVVGDQNNEKEIFGIEAKNIANVGTIAGQIVDSKIINVNISALNKADNVTIRGKNIVGGIVGLVKGESHLFNDTVENINVTSAYYTTPIKNISEIDTFNKYSRFGDNSTVSYAGGIAGIVDYYTAQTKDDYEFTEVTVISNATSVALKNVGNMIITGGTVGGIAGYIGPQTTMQDIQFMPYAKSVSDYAKQGLYSYNGFAGGIAGINKGYLRQVRSENDNVNIFDTENNLTLQEVIEKNSLSYYTEENGKHNYENSTIELGNKALFYNGNYSPIAVGGLVGLQESGKIEKSYSKLNVVNTNSTVAGGIIGIINTITGDNEATKLTEVYATGDVRGKEYTAGIVGRDLNTDITKSAILERVNALNLWGSWIFDSNKNGVDPIINNTKGDAGESKSRISDSYRLDQNYGFVSDPASASTWEGIKETQADVNAKYAEGYEFGEYFDYIFFANNWDANSWQRDTDELYPHMVFGYFDKTIKIKNQRDLEKLRTSVSSGKVTYIIEPDNSPENDNNGNEHYIGITRYIAPIVGFSNVLRGGEDPEATYGFVYKTDQTRALFETTLGATFSNFVVKYESNNIKQSSSLNGTSVLVRTANNTAFNNLTFSNINIDAYNNGNLNAGVLCAVAKGSCKFSNITFESCQINVKSNPSTVNVGLLFGEGKLSYDSNDLINVSVKDSKISLANDSLGNDSNKSYVGLVIGNVQSVLNNNSKSISISVTNKSGNQLTLGEGKTNPVFKNISVGSFFGGVEYAEISVASSNENASGKNEISLPKLIIPSIQNSRIGGIAGESRKCSFDNFSFIPSIEVGNTTFKNNSFGGVVGESVESSFKNVEIGSYEQKDGNKSTNKGSITINNISETNNIGTIVGKLENGQILDVKVYSNLLLKLADNKAQGQKLYIGGIAGYLDNSIVNAIDKTESEKDEASVSRVYSDIDLILSQKYEYSYDILLGGAFGFVKNSKVFNCYTTGDMKVDSKNNETNMVALYTSGLLAHMQDEANKDASVVANNISAGNIYPDYEQPTSNDKTSIKYGLYQDFVYGGIVGKIESEVASQTIANNYSINTLYNKADNKIGQNRTSINAILGEGSVDDKSVQNKYSNVYTLCTDEHTSATENIKLADLLNKTIKDKLNPKVDESEYYFIEGTKVNYATRLPSAKTNAIEVNEQYIYLGTEKIELSETTPITLKNSAIVGDGAILKLDNNNGKTKNIAPFGTIDSNSFVSGVVTTTLINNITSVSTGANGVPSASGFAYKNQGIIYSCNAGNRNSTTLLENINRGYVTSKGYASGFADTNEGLIKNCFTYLDVKSTYKGISTSSTEKVSASVTIAGFVRSNDGYIVTSFATGTIDNSTKKDNEDNNGCIYAFAPGKVYGSYTITKISNEGKLNKRESKERSFAFDENANNSYYDKLAIESLISEDNESLGKVTSKMSISYTDQNDTTESVYCGDFGIDKNYAFGYGSFSKNTYKNIDYMMFATGTGEETNPYKVPNLGKLQQLPDATQSTKLTCFVLDNDMDGEYVSAQGSGKNILGWISKDIKNVNLDGRKYDYSQKNINEQFVIANLRSDKGGIFNNILNSIINNIIFDNVIVYKISSLPSLGLLANTISGEAKITNITMVINVSTLSTSLDAISKCDSYNFGLIVGECNVEEDANTTPNGILNCIIQLKHSGVGDTDIKLTPNTNWTFGGAVGTLNSGRVSAISFIGGNPENGNGLSQISVQFAEGSSMRGKTYIVGGIVGQQNGGKIYDASLGCDLHVFDNSKTSNADQTLYAGGIVGKSNGGEISNCYTNEVNIVVGNHVEFLETYAGGISGFGGTIKNCKNNASVNSQAAYYYRSFLTYEVKPQQTMSKSDLERNGYEEDTDIGAYIKRDQDNKVVGYAIANNSGSYDVYTDTDKFDESNIKESTDGVLNRNNGFTRTKSTLGTETYVHSDKFKQYYNCYTKGDWFDSYSKLLYTRIQQKAYSAGIANSYNSVENSLNLSQNIYGGMDSMNIHSIYEVEMWRFVTRILTAIGSIGAIDTVHDLAATLIPIKSVSYAVRSACLLTGIGVTVATMSFSFPLYERYFAGNGYEYLTNKDFYYIGNQYNNSGRNFASVKTYVAGKDFNFNFSAEFATLLTSVISKSATSIAKLIIISLAAGKVGIISTNIYCVLPNVIDVAGNIIPQLTTVDDWVFPIGWAQPVDSGAITPDKLKEISQDPNYELNTLNYGGNEYYNSDSLNVYDVYFDPIGFPANGGKLINTMSKYQMYKSINISGKNYYGLFDNSTYTNEKGKKQSVFEAFNVVYNDKNAISKLTTASSEAEINSAFGTQGDWELVNGEWRLTNEIKKADMKDLLENVDIDGKDVTITIDNENVNVQPYELYNKAVELINNIDKSGYIENQQDTDTIIKLTSIKSINRAERKYIINVNAKVVGAQYALGTEEYPFNGKIVGTSKFGTNQMQFTEIAVPSLIAYGNNVEIENLKFSYASNNRNIALEDIGNSGLGGLVGYVQEGGEVNIKNVNVTYSLQDYKIDVKGNTNSSKWPNTIGGLVGYNKGDVTITNSNVIKLNIDLNGYEHKDLINVNSRNLGVGGIIGTNEGSLTLQDVEVYNMQISAKYSFNNIFGGIVGSNFGKIAEISNTAIGDYQNSTIDAESNQANIYVGGAIGYQNGNVERLSTISIDLKGIYAQTSNENATTYAGGLVGFADTNSKFKEIENVYVGKQGISMDDSGKYYQRMLIYSGIGGSSYANKAYADDIIGNRNDSGIAGQITSKVKVNAKSLSLAKFTYHHVPKNVGAVDSTKLLSDSNIINQTNIYYNEAYQITSSLTSNQTILSGYLKVDAYEYSSESFSGTNSNAYVNGEQYTSYNYHKTYLVNVIHMDRASFKTKINSKEQGEDRYEFTEVLYKVELKGEPSKDGEFSMDKNIGISLVAYNNYITDINIYEEYKTQVYPITDRYESYLPKSVDGHLFKVDESKLPTGSDDYSKYGDDNYEYEDPYVSCGYEGVDTTTAFKNKFAYLDELNNQIRCNLVLTGSITESATTSAKVKQSTQYTYKTIAFSTEDNKIKIEISFDKVITDEDGNVNISSEPVIRYMSYIYSTEENSNKIVYELQETMQDCFGDVTYEHFDMRYDIGGKTNTYKMLPEHKQTVKNEISFKTYMSKEFNMDSGSRVRIAIISQQKADTDSNSGLKVVDYVYLIKDSITYYMGTTTYNLNNEDAEKDNLERNDLYVPVIATNCENNLLPLNECKEVETCEISNTYSQTDIYYVFNVNNEIFKEVVTKEYSAIYTFTVGQFGIKLKSKDNKLISEETESNPISNYNNYDIYYTRGEDGRESGKYSINDYNVSENDNSKVITVSYTDNTVSPNVKTTISFTYEYDKDGIVSLIEKVVNGSHEVIYKSSFTTVGKLSYRISGNTTFYKFDGSEEEYTLLGQYDVTYDNSMYTFTNKDSDAKIMSFVIDENKNVVSVIYQQFDFFVKEGYTSNTISISKDSNFGNALQVVKDMPTILITQFDGKEFSSSSYITQNNNVPYSYYSLNMGNSEIQKFSSKLEKVQLTVVENLYVYAINDNLIIYKNSKQIYEKDNITSGLVINNATKSKFGSVQWVEVNYGTNSKIKIDIENGKEFIGYEQLSLKTKYDDSIKVDYVAYKYQGFIIFDITNYQKIEIKDTNVTLDTLVPIEKVTGIRYAIKTSANEYYLLNGGYKLTGTISSTERTYTVFGGVTGKFDYISVDAKYTTNNQEYSIKQNLMVQIGAITSSLKTETKDGFNFEGSKYIEQTKEFESQDESTFEGKGYQTLKDGNGKPVTDDGGNYIYYKNITENVDGEDVIVSTSRIEKKNGKWYLSEQVEQKTNITEIVRQIQNNTQQGFVTITDTLKMETNGEYSYPNYIYKISTSKKNIFDAITVVESDKTTIQSEYFSDSEHIGDSNYDWAKYISVGGQNVFGIEITRP